MGQKEIFLKGESNNWFKRNKEYLLNKESFKELDICLPYIKPKNKVLEIGCSFGTKLDYIKSKTDCIPYGIDPSDEGINEGKKRFKKLNLKVGSSDNLDFNDLFFDVTILGFCLYLVDRNLMFKTVSEVDRTLKEGGMLIITDFDTPFPYKKKYIHKEGINSFKHNYTKFFLNPGHYSLINKISHSHNELGFNDDFDERISTSLLYKERLDKIYPLK
ncbi:MAG: class I SAM-dependent methyltransferase [Flavobacteriaceae bacterium]